MFDVPPRRFAKKTSASNQGMALIIALAFITLIAALLVTYFATATSAVRSAADYKNGVAVQQLADAAVNVVRGQIADGTHTAKQGAPDESLVWTSQPGLIRTYGTDGAPYRFYKLYSSADMVLEKFDGGFWSPEENVAREVPDDWYEQRGLFTDLNQPALVAAEASGKTPPDGAISVGGKFYYANYPILDPNAQMRDAKKRDGIEGFAIDTKRISSAPA